jgi:outer membrane protein assembly factor BamA
VTARGRWIILAAAILWPAVAAPGAAAPPVVTAVEISASQSLPEAFARIGHLAGKALSRDAVRTSLERLWGLGLFSTIRVVEIPGPGGVSLRYELTERPLVHRIRWEGQSGIDLAEAAAVAGLALGEASPGVWPGRA